MRHIWKYDRKLGKVVKVSDEEVLRRTTTLASGEGPHIMPDIEPYKAVGLPGAPMIRSRSEHREALKRHGMIEVGNEKPDWMKEEDYASRYRED